MPSWAEKAIENGELFSINLQDRVFKDQVLHVLDYLNTYIGPIKFDYSLAVQKAEEYFNQLKKRAKDSFDSSGVEKIKEYGDGFYWAKITSEHELQREGKLMNHCVGSYWAQVQSAKVSILSLRDLKNIPHCTVEYKGKNINQIKGNSNGVIKKEYIKYVEDLLSSKVIRVEKIDGNDLIKIGLIKDIKGDIYSLDKIQKDITVDNLNLSNMKLERLLNLSRVKVLKDFNCNDNNLTSLEGCPKEIGKHFTCTDNNLTSLKSGPKEVGGSFICSRNKLISLEGAPQKVNINFDCSANNLTSLRGAPKEVSGNFYCYSNKLTSLEGAPKEVGGVFYCFINKVNFTEKDIRKVSDIKGRVN